MRSKLSWLCHGWPLVWAIALHLIVLAAATLVVYRQAHNPDMGTPVAIVPGNPASRTSTEMNRDLFERKGIPSAPRLSSDPAVYFPDARETDHNESSERSLGRMKGDSEEYLSAMPGEGGGIRGRNAGTYDSMGVGSGGGGGGHYGATHGGRRNLQARGGGGAAAPRAQRPAGLPVAGPSTQPDSSSNSEEYSRITDNPFERVGQSPLSTFSIDVDTASYSNVRRFIASGQLPPKDAVRIEELLNNFKYDYAAPTDGKPFSVSVEEHAAPWAPKHRLVRIGLRGQEIDLAEAPSANLVFLVDVSGSMSPEDRLPLVKKSLNLLVDQMRKQDTISIVVYAGQSGMALAPTSGDQKETIRQAIERMNSGGGTNGAGGIKLAYEIAAKQFIKGGINRVLLCTDGDFNVGVSSEGDLSRLIEEKRETGVFLSVLGYGRGNLADARMQALADKGNGNAAYIDSMREARKVLVQQASGTLITIAKDVKIQVEFNPTQVAGYRLIGYENRMLAARDFNDDKKDAGEIGAGHQVTALYEVIPAGQVVPGAEIDALKYQAPKNISTDKPSSEMLTVKLRFKKPDGDSSEKIDFALQPSPAESAASVDFEFAAAVAMYGMLLREAPDKGTSNWALVRELAKGGSRNHAGTDRKEFVEIVDEAARLMTK